MSEVLLRPRLTALFANELIAVLTDAVAEGVQSGSGLTASFRDLDRHRGPVAVQQSLQMFAGDWLKAPPRHAARRVSRPCSAGGLAGLWADLVTPPQPGNFVTLLWCGRASGGAESPRT